MQNNALFTDALGLHVSHDGFTLAGVGNQSFLYREGVRIKLPQHTRYKKVQGFALGPERGQPFRQLLVYADNEYSLFNYATENRKDPFELLFEGRTKDWINAASFLAGEEDCQFVLHLAHSVLLRVQYHWRAHTKFGGWRILELARCIDYSMLYYTHLHGDRFKKLVVMSGNGFGELLIWQPLVANDVTQSLNTRFKLYPLIMRLEAHNGVIFSIDFNPAAQLLITTSDDRSVKYWQVHNISETGNWQNTQVTPKFSCFGHTARVMCAIVVEYDNKVYVISGGEDSFVCVWDSGGKLILKRRQQFGASIWRLAFDPDTATLYSAGSTGNVLAYNLQQILSRGNQLTPLSTPKTADSDEFMRKVKFLNHHTVVGVSSKSRFLYMDLKKSTTQHVWQSVANFPTFKCTVLAVHGKHIAICGFRNFSLISHNSETGLFEQLHNGDYLEDVIRSFHFIAEDRYFLSDRLGNCVLLNGHKFEVETRLILPRSREPWVTAALLVSPNCLLLSNRDGHVMLYSREIHESEKFELKNTLKRLHGDMGATLFQILKLNAVEAYILSAGHEPTVRFLHINFLENALVVCQRENVPLAWIEASLTSDVLLGFNDDHFIAWSRQHDVLMQLKCGGGHRCWDYYLQDEELHTLFVKSKQVLYYKHKLYENVINSKMLLPRNPWHIRCCNILRLLVVNNEQSLIISGSDDNLIKVGVVMDEVFQEYAELHTHISSVRHLKLLPITSNGLSNSWLIFSVGGRAQLCINQLNVIDSEHVTVKELCTHTVQTDTAKGNVVVEARLMAIDVLHNTATGHFSLYIASAEGKVLLFHWHPQKPKELQLQFYVNVGHCPLQLHCIAQSNLVLFTTTSGVLCVFDLSLRTAHLQLQLHEAGVNNLDAIVDENLLHVMSGGDDENLFHTTIDLESMQVRESNNFFGLHNGQVNAVIIQTRQSTSNGHLYAYTCGVDKQVHEINLLTNTHKKIGDTCIDDIKGMMFDVAQRVYFYGCGLEVMPLKQ